MRVAQPKAIAVLINTNNAQTPSDPERRREFVKEQVLPPGELSGVPTTLL
ncbi:MAG: hypothetical protein F6J98_02700 [Moorea sp. SIO4G2]|nr:hypothetical protein [Moorena sp. SIO4G2]